jgi:alpha-tubulin suppressor-like RCC1 family protein
MNCHLTGPAFLSALLLAAMALHASAAPGALYGWGSVPGGDVISPFTNITKVSAGKHHFLTLDSAGNYGAWGSEPQSVTQLTNNLFGGTLVAVAAGDGRSAGLWSTGHVTWNTGHFGGNNWENVTAISMRGQQAVVRFSDGTVAVDRGTPPPAGLANVTTVAAGNDHALALKSDGTVTAWGADYAGQRTVPAGLAGVTAIAAGGYHSLALRSNGTVVAWGGTGLGYDLGQGTVPADLSGVTAIAAGLYHSVALKSDGTVVCWGECGTPPPLRNVQTIAAGDYYTVVTALPSPEIAVFAGDVAVLDGSRQDFYVPGFTTLSRTFTVVNHGNAPLTGLVVSKDGPEVSAFTVSAPGTATLVPGQFTTFTVTFQPFGAGAHYGAVRIASNDADEAIYDINLLGRVPMGAMTLTEGGRPDWFMDRVPVISSNIRQVASAMTFSAIVRSDGSVTSWGGDMEAGKGVWNLAPPAAWPGVKEVALGTNANTGAVITNDGAVYEWSPLGAAVSSQILPPSANVQRLAAGSGHFLAIRLPQYRIHAWGLNNAGQTDVPAGLTQVLDIAAGGNFSAALLSDGSVVAWGANHLGQTNVPPGLRAVDIAAAGNSLLALRSDGTVAAWGHNITLPAGLTNIVAVEGGPGGGAAIRNDGTMVPIGWAMLPPGMPRVGGLGLGALQKLAMNAPTPEIGIAQAGGELRDGFGFDFGWTPAGTPLTKTFTITNSGAGGTSFIVARTGPQAAEYSVGGFPTLLLPGASADFTITLTPAAIGPRIATLSITSSDQDENPFDIPLAGRTPMYVSAWGGDSVDYGETRVPQGLNDAVAVAAGGTHSLALRSNGTVAAWGNNDSGQTTVPPGLANV